MIKKETFFRCELKLFIFLFIGIVILNILGLILQNLFNTALLISISLTIFVFLIYIVYFVFMMFKIYVFKYDFECKDIRKRLASWFSSLI